MAGRIRDEDVVLVRERAPLADVVGESVQLRAFNPSAPFDEPIRWRATVTRMDGRRIDLLELAKVGHRSTSTHGEADADE